MNSKKILIIAILAIIAVGAGAFYGGTKYEKSNLSKQGLLRSGNNLSQGGDRQPGAQGQNRQFPGVFGRGANGAGFASGQVISKDDKSITIKMQDGSSKIVYFSDSTTVGKSTQSATSDLSTGEQVMVNGKSNPDGSLSAQNIQIRPEQQN